MCAFICLESYVNFRIIFGKFCENESEKKKKSRIETKQMYIFLLKIEKRKAPIYNGKIDDLLYFTIVKISIKIIDFKIEQSDVCYSIHRRLFMNNVSSIEKNHQSIS